MGKQINYYIDYENFIFIAQKALQNGCKIIKKVNEKYIISSDISIVTKDCNMYYFYFPNAGDLILTKGSSGERIENKSYNALIEAGYSYIDDVNKKIIGSRLYIISGYYDDNEQWIPRPECLEKVYNRLAYSVRKMTIRYYAVEKFLNLIREQGYSLM